MIILSDYIQIVFFFLAAEEVASHCVYGTCCQEDHHHCVSLPVCVCIYTAVYMWTSEQLVSLFSMLIPGIQLRSSDLAATTSTC